MKYLAVVLFIYAGSAFSQTNFELTYSLFRNPELHFIEPLKNGGYIISGRCQNITDSTTDFCFIKLDAGGNVVWTKQFVDQSVLQGMPMNEWATTVREDSDGSLVFGGCVDDPNYNSSGAYFGRLDSSGNLISSSVRTTAWATSVNSMLLNPDGKFVTTRDDNAGAGHHSNSLEINSSAGNYVGGASVGNFSIANQTLVRMSDGGYGNISIEETFYFDPSYNNLPIVTRSDAHGQIIWSYRIHNEVFGSDTQFTALCSTVDTGLLVCGFAQSGGMTDIFITRFNSSGDSLWTKKVNGLQNASPSSIQQTSDGGFAIAGYNNSDVLLVKLDENGNNEWIKTYGGNNLDRAIYFQQTPDDGFVILAHSQSFGTSTIYILKTDASGNTSNNVTTTGKVDPRNEIKIYPDPFSSTLFINLPDESIRFLTMRDMTGKVVFTSNVNNFETRLDLSFLAPGIYMASVSGGKNLFTKLLVRQ